jgi:hypothetical protein
MADSLGLANDGRAASGKRALATVFGEEGNEAVHRRKACGVDHGAAVAAHRDKPGRAQPVEMEREGVGGEAELFGDVTGRHAVRSGLDQQAEDFQPVFLRQCGQGRDGVYRFHISTIIEISPVVKDISTNAEITGKPRPGKGAQRRAHQRVNSDVPLSAAQDRRRSVFLHARARRPPW